MPVPVITKVSVPNETLLLSPWPPLPIPSGNIIDGLSGLPGTQSSATFSHNTAYFHPIYIPVAQEWSGFRFAQTSTNVGATAYLALYDMGEDGIPTPGTIATGSQTMDLSGNKSAAFNEGNKVLQPGWYYTAYCHSVASCGLWSLGACGAWCGFDPAGTGLNGAVAQTYTAGAFPSDPPGPWPPTSFISTAPRVGLMAV